MNDPVRKLRGMPSVSARDGISDTFADLHTNIQEHYWNRGFLTLVEVTGQKLWFKKSESVDELKLY
ncbi:hypothetical protein F441_18010 [Phytophthora nicotianae CJ01A1]|uniref:Uncharacterized protein n=6 Tax=Phytophthora nicotianae TaxID=4792 RepID=W2YH14_PHYNI|nr:hypothetical protein L915_17657 [Phytophthora nicotianae]ETO64262.1 hypothetical protein F444_18155 [Phytophthora nicotianae P1976]ETP05355.1 hypothetical protein F441_18010 [Phytophthora nicotianae CJ01A1]ETP33484.1 hypothetical protein F442_17979 [Phytophthora nicotianae P10297]ETL29215.1 hypothetical protein L916_17550 [Phytophthora nicotianae]